jgi:opacity protein-like surface antigen
MHLNRLCQAVSLLFIFICFLGSVRGEPNQRDSKYADVHKEFDEIRATLLRLRAELSDENVEVEKTVAAEIPVVAKPSGLSNEFDVLRHDLEKIQLQLSGNTGRKISKPVIEVQDISQDNFIPPTYQIRGTTSSGRDGAQRGVGFYILPFIGVHSPKNLEWRSVGGDFQIEEESGFSSGLRLGYGQKYFFADFQLSYFYNELENVDLGSTSISFSGKAEGMGGHLSAGFNIPFSRSFNLALGAGLGGTHQDITFKLMGIPVREEDFLFSYQLFTGLEFYPTDHLRFGLRYRWLRVEDMDLFTDRDLHLAELALGYVF